jgi:quinohemoprotein ethanol dehydrogenase
MMPTKTSVTALATGFAALLAGATAPPAQAAGHSAHEWPSYGLDTNEDRYSPLTQIDAASVSKLGLAWSLDLPKQARSLEGTPIEVNRVVYFTTSLSVVYAVDAVTGRRLWDYDPKAWEHNPQAFRTTQGYHRGVAYHDGAVFVGSSDGRLISLDAKTGKPNWITDTVHEENSRKQITGAPRVFNGKVIIGHAGADVGSRGCVTAYDEKSGKQVWRFWTVPRDPREGPQENETLARALKTWSGNWYKWGGGGAVWNAITFDPEFNRIYFGTSNSANYDPKQRNPENKDNLFLASIVAVAADTGKYIWHYQVNPNEAWDFKATADMVLADLTIAGRRRKVLMQAPTNGFFYVIDRSNGTLISAEKLGKVTWADRIDLKTGRPVEKPGIRYEQGATTFWPSPWGVHNWQAMSYSPKTGLVYIPTMKLPATYNSTPQDKQEADGLIVGSKRYWFPIGASFGVAKIDPDDGTGALVAWDPVKQKAAWKVRYSYMWNGGTLVTASDLVFQGAADGWFHAYDATSGREVWKYFVKNGVIAPPITYEVDGTQYISLLVGYGGATPPAGRLFDPGWRYGRQPPRILTFTLGGTAEIPPTPGPDYSVHPIDDPSVAVDEAAAARGQNLWNHTCLLCHGVAGVGAGPIAPDLRESIAAHNFDALRGILHDGLLVAGGMPKFDDRTDDEVRELLAYIRKISRDASQLEAKQ